MRVAKLCYITVSKFSKKRRRLLRNFHLRNQPSFVCIGLPILRHFETRIYAVNAVNVTEGMSLCRQKLVNVTAVR